jgi:hypothetical protein
LKLNHPGSRRPRLRAETHFGVQAQPLAGLSRQWKGDVAPPGRKVGATGSARGAPQASLWQDKYHTHRPLSKIGWHDLLFRVIKILNRYSAYHRRLLFFGRKIDNFLSGAPQAKARGSSTCFVGRNPPKHTLLRSFGASKGTLLAFIHGLKTRGFLRRRVKRERAGGIQFP